MSSGVASQPATGHDCGGGTLAMAQAYNVTPFLDSHPGGAKVILAYAGKDATGDFTMLHRPGILEKVRHLAQQACARASCMCTRRCAVPACDSRVPRAVRTQRRPSDAGCNVFALRL